MSLILVPARDQVSPESQALFDILKKRVGKVPNLYATMGYSSHALKAFLDMEEILYQGVFTPKEREAVALIVSEFNGCAYCLAAHTALAVKRGFTKEETLLIRRGGTGITKLDRIIRLARSIAEHKGKPDQRLLADFYNEGFDDGAVMELIGLVVLRAFTNYVFALTEIPVDFEPADPLS
jgi:uncharacterized peroxidase-related enzyme